VQGMREDMDLHVLVVDEFSVEPDLVGLHAVSPVCTPLHGTRACGFRAPLRAEALAE
jgi:hypothetical protein